MTELTIVKHSDMKRIWWIYYKWEVVTALEDKEPMYLNAGIRPINEAAEAEKQFDTSWNAKNDMKFIK